MPRSRTRDADPHACTASRFPDGAIVRLAAERPGERAFGIVSAYRPDNAGGLGVPARRAWLQVAWDAGPPTLHHPAELRAATGDELRQRTLEPTVGAIVRLTEATREDRGLGTARHPGHFSSTYPRERPRFLRVIWDRGGESTHPVEHLRIATSEEVAAALRRGEPEPDDAREPTWGASAPSSYRERVAPASYGPPLRTLPAMTSGPAALCPMCWRELVGGRCPETPDQRSCDDPA